MSDASSHPRHPGGHPGGHPGRSPEQGHDRFQRQYAEGTAPWDIGRPQPEMVALEEAGEFGHRVLDLGCGRGALSLFLAKRGHDVVGIDGSSVAIGSAHAAAAERDVDVVFVEGDVLDVLLTAHDAFEAAVDVGFFHALTDDQRRTFAERLAGVLDVGGVYATLCFSDRVPGEFGPRRVAEAEIRDTFSGSAWRVREVRPAVLVTARPDRPEIDANLALIDRV